MDAYQIVTTPDLTRMKSSQIWLPNLTEMAGPGSSQIWAGQISAKYDCIRPMFIVTKSKSYLFLKIPKISGQTFHWELLDVHAYWFRINFLEKKRVGSVLNLEGQTPRGVPQQHSSSNSTPPSTELRNAAVCKSWFAAPLQQQYYCDCFTSPVAADMIHMVSDGK